MLGEVCGLDAVAEPHRSGHGLAPEDRLEQRRLAGAVRPHEPDVLAALDRERRLVEQLLIPGRHLEAAGLDDGPAAACWLEEVEAERLAPPIQELQLAGCLRPLLLQAADLRQLRLRLLRL